ncbi:hypothetical protein H6P81_008463 [Aristolochia fimbriata]|uniref:Kinesin light chain n=1 Tax=Aristolochia fimbriata TaxID=158543 RepID=A0AAV7EIA4_ARIFI|nr:hypothetical protein H6P81_008463 [Aristolochia fimbriata]
MFSRQASGLSRRLRFVSRAVAPSRLASGNNSSRSLFCENNSRFSSSHKGNLTLWALLSGQVGILLGMNSNISMAESVSVDKSVSQNDFGEAYLSGLRKIEDGSVISNEHTSKWRIFTDNGRDLFQKGKFDEAESYFLSALQEAKEGFGERDPHVASACNNLGELYRVRKTYDKAEPLYLEAINILEESFGPEDIRVGAALHNLGQFYLGQRKLEEARACYERSLKIKGRVLGLGHPDYANTMYHLGVVLNLLGKEKDSEALIQDSIRILEECGLGESVTCIRRMKYLAQILIRSNRLPEAENVQRKSLHVLELAKGWESLDTVLAAEELALTLQSIGNLSESRELLERCLEVRKKILREDNIQVSANMLHLARNAMLNSNKLRKRNITEANIELDKAKNLLDNSIRIAQKVLNNLRSNMSGPQIGGEVHAAVVILLQSIDAFGLVEITKHEMQEPKEETATPREAEIALSQLLTIFKEPGIRRAVLKSPELKAEYLSCLKHLLNLFSQSATDEILKLKEEIELVEPDLSSDKRRRK